IKISAAAKILTTSLTSRREIIGATSAKVPLKANSPCNRRPTQQVLRICYSIDMRKSLSEPGLVCWLLCGKKGPDGAHGKAGCIDYRSHRARWRVPCRIPAQQGLCRAWPEAALVLVQHRADRSSLSRPARAGPALCHALRRHDGRYQPHSDRPGDAAG